MSVKMDYKDDIFFGKRRYNTINNSDGTISLDDVTEYRQEGDTFGAGDMNTLAAAVNGFEAKHTDFPPDGSVVETDASGNTKRTVFNDDGSITETLTDSDGNVIATKTTTFNDDGSIDEEVV